MTYDVGMCGMQPPRHAMYLLHNVTFITSDEGWDIPFLEEKHVHESL